MTLYTIGFTRRTAEDFFRTLRDAKCGLVVDVRLNNTSQLAGFAKRDDLSFFLREIRRAQYRHEPLLAPSEALFTAHTKGGMSWNDFESEFRTLLSVRHVETAMDRGLLNLSPVLLCSEFSPERCHRRLAAEYLKEKWGGFEIVHL